MHSHPRLHDQVLSKEHMDNAIIPLSPRKGEVTLRTEDILKVLDENKDQVSSSFHLGHSLLPYFYLSRQLQLYCLSHTIIMGKAEGLCMWRLRI